MASDSNVLPFSDIIQGIKVGADILQGRGVLIKFSLKNKVSNTKLVKSELVILHIKYKHSNTRTHRYKLNNFI